VTDSTSLSSRATTENTVGNTFVREQAHHFGDRIVALEQNFVRGATDAKRGLLGKRYARAHFDEPPAITFEQFRKWSDEVDRERRTVEGAWERRKRIFGD